MGKTVSAVDSSANWVDVSRCEIKSSYVSCSFATYIVSKDGRYYKQQYIYVGEDAAEKFLECILAEVLDLRSILRIDCKFTVRSRNCLSPWT